MKQRKEMERTSMRLFVIGIIAVTCLAMMSNNECFSAQSGGRFGHGNVDASDATNLPLYFDGMQYGWSGRYSWFGGSMVGTQFVTDIGGGLFNITSAEFGNRTVNGTTRVITDDAGTSNYVIGSHDWLVIFNNITISDVVPITIFGPTGDQAFTVQGLNEIVAGSRLYTCWRMTSPQGSLAFYDRYSGILVNGTFTFVYMSTTYTYYVQILSTNKPLAPNAQAPVLSGDAVNPTSGTQATPFNFSVTYTDADNNGPMGVWAVVNGTYYPLSKINPSDMNYTDGNRYSAAIYFQPGSYVYYFVANDGMYPATTTAHANLTVGTSNSLAPSLSNPSALPKIGLNGTTDFVFRITFTDPDNNAPQYVNLTVEGAVYPMQKQDPLDTNFLDGCVYNVTTKLYVMKNVTYQFIASDGIFNTSTATYTDVDVRYAFPLFFNGMTYNFNLYIYGAGTFLITSSYTKLSSGLFQVTTTGSVPLSRIVNGTSREVVDGQGHMVNGSHDWVRIHPYLALNDRLMVANFMAEDCEIRVTGTASMSAGFGTFQCWELTNTAFGHTFYYDQNTGLLIYGSLYSGQLTITPTSTNLNMVANSYKPILSSMSMVPAEGNESTTFTFLVTYTDADNNAPSWMYLLIDGTRYSLSKQNTADNTYTDGCIYRYIGAVPEGDHTHYFETFDGKFMVQSSVTTGPNVTRINNYIPILTNPTLTPSTGSNGTTVFSFRVTYTDADNNFPSYMNVYIDGVPYVMTRNPITDTNFTNGCVFELNTTLGIGAHTHSFNGSDGTTAVSLGTFDGPVVSANYNWGQSNLVGVRIGYDTYHSRNPFSAYGGSFVTNSLYARGAAFVNINTPITAGILSTIDILWCDQGSYVAWTTAEVDAVQQWIHAGGSVMLSGDASTPAVAGRFNITYLSIPDISQYTSAINPHPITTGISQLAFTYTANSINLTAQPSAIWCAKLTGYDMIAAMEYGNGRMVIICSQGFLWYNMVGNMLLWNNSMGWLGHPINYYRPVLSGESVSPGSGLGNQSTLYTFSVTYTDEDNSRPFTINVVIDGIHYAMTKLDPADGNYTDGCTYVYQALLPPGTRTYSFECSDQLFFASTANNTLVVLTTNLEAPQILNPNLTPVGGFNNTIYNFTFTYVDADNNMPIAINVTINSSVYTMTKVVPSDINAMDGIVYSFACTLPFGTYQYRFQCHDGGFPANTGWLAGPVVHPYYTLPNTTVFFEDFEGDLSKWSSVTSLWHITSRYALSPTHSIWFGNESTGVYPNSASGEMISVPIDLSTLNKAYLEFYHRIRSESGYDYARVYVSVNNGSWTQIYAFAGTIASWSKATFNISSYCGNSNVRLRFYFSSDSSINYEGWFIDNIVIYPNYTQYAPILVSPGNGTTFWNENVTFTWRSLNMQWGRTNYTWQLSDSPTFSSILLEREGIREMASTNTNETILLDLPTGLYYWRVRATCDQYAATWSAYRAINVIHNDLAPSLTSGSVAPINGNLATMFLFSVLYTDADNNPPTYVNVLINGTSHAMAKENASDTDYTDGAMYRFATMLPVGPHEFYFTCSDGLRTNSTILYLGPSVTPENLVPPSLSSVAVTPTQGSSTTVFNFTARYYDIDNNVPVMINITINGTTYNMTKAIPADTNATDGILYYYTTTLAFGYYQFQVQCFDGLYSIASSIIPAPEVNPFLGTATVYAFFDNFEAGTGQWATIEDLWHITDTWPKPWNDTEWWDPSYSGTHSMWCGNESNGLYNNNMDSDLITRPLDFTGFTGLRFFYAWWCNVYGENWYIYYRINGGSWVQFYSLGGWDAPWRTIDFALSSALNGQSNVQFRFRFVSGATEVHRGLIIDDVRIYGVGPVPRVSLVYPTNGGTTFSGLSNYTWQSYQASFGAVNYTWQMSDTPSFSTILHEVSGIPEMTGLTTASIDPGVPDGTYYWRVRPTYGPFAGEWSTTYTVTLTPNNNVPVLNGSVSPPTGDQFSVFNFRVTYTDADNNAPLKVDVFINGTRHPMTKVNAGDTNYVDGCLYQYSTTLAIGTYQYNFVANDGRYTGSSPIYTGFQVIETNYHVPTIQGIAFSPLVGHNMTVFTFTAWYYDEDNNQPVIANITLNSTTYNMTKVTPSDFNAMNGIQFTFSTTLGWGSYQYRISFYDGLFTNTTALLSGPLVTPLTTYNLTLFYDDFESGTAKWTAVDYPWHVSSTWGARSPTNAMWFGQEGLNNYPNNANSSLVSVSIDLSKPRTAYLEFFQYMATEAGYDFMYVHVRKDGGPWMQLYSSSGNIAAWQRQVLNISAFCGSSNVQIRFWATSDAFVVARGWIIDDVKVFAAWPDKPTLIAPANMSTTFGGLINFTWSSLQLPIGAVNYTWQMSNSPDFATILDQVFNIPETTNQTTLQRAISLLSGNYYWRVVPTCMGFTGTPATPFTLIVFVNTVAPSLSQGGVDPSTGSELSSYLFTVTYTDLDNNAPASIFVIINGTPHAMSKQNAADLNYDDGCIYQYSSALGIGIYSYYFNCSDGLYSNTTIVYAGPSVFRAPTSNSPPDSFVLANATGVTIAWQLTTYSGIGQYSVLRNGTQVQSWTTWLGNNTNINFPVETNAGLGVWNYTILYNDSMSIMGTPDFVLITVNDIPWVTIGNGINNTYIPGNATGYVIPWTFHDLFGGTGTYQLLRNGTSIASSTWTNGFLYEPFVNTNIGYHTFNYTLRYSDGCGTPGIESHVLVTVVRAPTSNHPVDRTVIENATGNSITWRLYTYSDIGSYQILRNGLQLVGWTSWLGNDTDITISVDTDIGIGIWNYTIQYNDSLGYFGVPDTVLVSVNDLPHVTGGSAMNNTAIPANSSASFAWTISDTFGATGSYTISVNGVPGTPAAWNNGVAIPVTIDTNSGFGTFTYMIQYTDMYGAAGAASQVIVSVVGPPSSNSPDDVVLLQGSGDRTITWTLTDRDGEGLYRVRRNALVIVDWTPWVNGSDINVTASTSLAVGLYSFVIEFNNTHGIARSDAVQVTIEDLPICIQAPSNLEAVKGSTDRTMSWTLIDGIGGGTFTLYINGQPSSTYTNVPWTNNTPFTIIANTNVDVGSYNYTLRFKDSNGFNGTQSTVILTITAAATNPIIDFIMENILYIVIGGVGIVVIASVAAVSRKKKAVKAKVKQKQSKKPPETMTFPAMDSRAEPAPKKKLPDVYMDAGPKQQVMLPTGMPPGTTGPAIPATVTPPIEQAAPAVPATAKFYCSRCAKYYDIDNPDMVTWYSCPTCNDMLTYVVNCPLCNYPIGLTKENHDRLKNTGMTCSNCQGIVKF